MPGLGEAAPQSQGLVLPPDASATGSSLQTAQNVGTQHRGHHGHHGHHGHRHHHRSNGQKDGDSHAEIGRGPISLLQEFVQCSTQFQAPQHRPILQWGFDTRMENFTSLEFRATVAFVLDGLPHHVAGGWRPSKKLAQRDAAERSLSFFVGRWGEVLLMQQGGSLSNPSCPARDGISPSADLESCLRTSALCEGSELRWSIEREGERCCAVLELDLLGVRHKFPGQPCGTEEAARTDTVRRVLWYLRLPGFEDAFEPDPEAPAITALQIPSPPANWANSAQEEEDALQVAERKTVLMRLQNRLQQEYGRLLKPGQSMWEWTYETNDSDEGWPPLCRATVHIPVAGREFTGGWARGQREAQIDASARLVAFLDGEERHSGGSEECSTAESRAGSVNSD